MMVYTNSRAYASCLLPEEAVDRFAPVRSPKPGVAVLLDGLFDDSGEVLSTGFDGFPSGHLFISESSPRSQYDQLIEWARSRTGLPDRVFCLAGSGQNFHGFKGRSWASVPGNLHLAVHLSPGRSVDRFEVAFTALAALSVAEAIDRVPGVKRRARIKWVNDILMDDAKVAGILAYTQSQAHAVTSAVLGMGLNVEATPPVAPTPFVPRVASVRDFLPPAVPDVRARILGELLAALDRSYQILLEEGTTPLLEAYRSRSMVVGREVTLCTESSDEAFQVVAEGVVSGLGDRLELFLEERAEGFVSGRLVMGQATDQGRAWEREAPAGVPVQALSGRNAAE